MMVLLMMQRGIKGKTLPGKAIGDEISYDVDHLIYRVAPMRAVVS